MIHIEDSVIENFDNQIRDFLKGMDSSQIIKDANITLTTCLLAKADNEIRNTTLKEILWTDSELLCEAICKIDENLNLVEVNADFNLSTM